MRLPTDCLPSVLERAAFQNVAKIKDGFALSSAATRLIVHGGKPTSCSASYVSDQGHVLTAAHCLEGCVTRDKVPKFPAKDIQCDVTLGGRKMKARIVVMATCHPKLMIESTLNGRPTCEDQGDLAILMPETPPKDFGCLKIATRLPEVDHTVTAIGYPKKTTRRGPGNSDGVNMHISRGKIVQKDHCVRIAKKNREEVALSGAENLQKRFIQSTADIVQGSSGGPLVNSSGEIVGVAMAHMGDNDKYECPGSAFFESLVTLDPMSRKWGTRQELEDMQCSRRLVKISAR